MEKLFIYNVNGEKFEDTKAWGEAWVKAQELAKNEHCGIFREVASKNYVRTEFLAKCGVFLNAENQTTEEILESIKFF